MRKSRTDDAKTSSRTHRRRERWSMSRRCRVMTSSSPRGLRGWRSRGATDGDERASCSSCRSIGGVPHTHPSGDQAPGIAAMPLRRRWPPSKVARRSSGPVFGPAFSSGASPGTQRRCAEMPTTMRFRSARGRPGRWPTAQKHSRGRQPPRALRTGEPREPTRKG